MRRRVGIGWMACSICILIVLVNLLAVHLPAQATAAPTVEIATLANLLGGSLGQSVVDKTGLSGHFDLRLEWTPTESERNYTFDDRPIDFGGSSIFTALQEQLGLKLEPGRGPVEVFVIDHIERPSEN